MPETVLAGVDPTQPAIDAQTGQQLTLEEMLRRRGLLAVGGRYTMFPNASDPSASATQPDSVAAAQLAANGGAASTANPAGTAAGGVSASPAAPTANANAPLPVPDETLDGMDENTATELLVGLGLGGAALAAYLMRRRAKLSAAPIADAAEEIPLVEGEVIEDGKPVTSDNLVDGKVKQTTKVIPASQTKRITQDTVVPDNAGMKALGAPKEVPLNAEQNRVGRSAVAGALTDQRKPDTRARARDTIARGQRKVPNDLDTIPAKDAYTDMTPDEMAYARSLVQQLKQNRRAGNAVNIRRKQGVRNARSTLPTGTVNEESLLNTVIRSMRLAKQGRNVARIVR